MSADGTDDVLIPLAIELTMLGAEAGLDGDEDELMRAVSDRLDATLTSQEDAYELITTLALLSGNAVNEWARVQGCEVAELMQAMGLSVAKSMYTDDD